MELCILRKETQKQKLTKQISLQVVKECYERKQGLKWRIGKEVRAAVAGSGPSVWVDEEGLSEKAFRVLTCQRHCEAGRQRSDMPGPARNLSSIPSSGTMGNRRALQYLLKT